MIEGPNPIFERVASQLQRLVDHWLGEEWTVSYLAELAWWSSHIAGPNCPRQFAALSELGQSTPVFVFARAGMSWSSHV